MKKTTSLFICVAVAVLFAGSVQGGKQETSSAGAWIHIEVKEDGGKESSVKVNLPLVLAEAALAAAEGSLEGRLSIGAHTGGDFKISDLRQMWRAMRDAGDAEFVTVQEEGEQVRVYTQGENVHVDVDGGADDERVRVRMPAGMMDALLAGDGEELNVSGALAYLRTAGRHGELVRVEDGSELVRIWIDETPESAGR